ncbi:nitroimidazol reductase NimA-like FMN-containing flavoprotein (pyridoxamine 5'-phosphate oxidase superfamily) [Pseudarthrobacter sp. W1I19]|uniref:pyridoxamine 5'-phosphate oxidase family protein n=1 Tax=Pseudarthrobacter sp. W1I19 TaxID=3042288 RepID=UPI002787D398|nr:pyridoxamine 5'-phosphate oxidase family protein [Pseudarthrobacter sp. W1I19]MDQ0924634.1 nitroimidazol reductase NimA-like FMN-containing flavoprotein (pyridoxamine 5'-phosphate oxidase superfamily) [Pseudarthrobacter sp. W1I19]
MDTAEPGQTTENLSVHDCWKYLRSVSVCRVAVTGGDGTDIFPVNYVPNYGTVIFRTGPGTKLDALLAIPAVVLEADGMNSYGTIAWSVVIKGLAEVVSNGEELQEAAEAGLSPWQPGVKDTLVRVTPKEISGRRFVISSPLNWWPPLDSASSEPKDAGQTT